MVKKITAAFALIISVAAFSQVGINTDTPQSTLDVSVVRNTGGILTDNTQTYGLQAPRLTRAELTANTAIYGTQQEGALIYITDVSGGDVLGQRVNITTVGYYYFDGTEWKAIRNSTTAQEPWNVQGTTTPATLNTDNIYQSGSVAIGKNAVQTGAALDVEGAVRGGTGHTGTVGDYSVAFGSENQASGFASTAFGDQNTASDLAMVFGSANTASALFSTAFGTGNASSGTASTAFGNFNQAIGSVSTAFGDTNIASGEGSTAFGLGNIASGEYELVFGKYNALTASSTALLQIGNGTSDVSRTNALTILNNANMGILTTTPTEKLDVDGITRLRSLPLDGATNAINTTPAGNASASQNQTFTASKTVVADANGVLGYIDGIPTAGPGSSKMVVSASVPIPGTQNIGSNSGGGNINYPLEFIDTENAFSGSIFTAPETGIYLISTQLALKHTATGATDGWFNVAVLQKLVGSTWVDLARDTSSNNLAGDVDNGNILYWTGSLSQGEQVRIRIICNANTANRVDLGSLTILQLLQ